MTGPEPHDDALYAEVHRLVTDVLQSCSVDAADRLSAFLADGEDLAERYYTAYMHETHALRRAGSDASQLLPPLDLFSQGTGSQGTGSQGTGSQGTGSQGTGSQGTGNDMRRPLAMRSYQSRLATFAAIAASFAVAVSLWNTGEPTGVAFTEAEPRFTRDANGASVATLVRASRVVWRPGDAPLSDLSRLLPGERIRIDSGQVEIVFDTGVELVIAGRADAVIESDMRVVGKLGKFSARVSDRGRGFTIETPATDVIDLGTEVGVEIDSFGGTKVAVFQGEVDLLYDGDRTGRSAETAQNQPERLRVGEAVQIDAAGERTRLVAVASNDFPTHGSDRNFQDPRPVLFAAVRDNLRSPSNKKFYRVIHGGLFDDARAYVDRNHEWNGLDSHGLPTPLRGADYVMPFNDDKFVTGFELTLEMAAPCTLYIFFNNNMTTPDWLVASFEDTGIDLGLDEAFGRYSGDASLATGGGMSIDRTFSVWARTIDRAGEIRLGGVDKPANKDAGWNMYGIAATPIPAALAER